MKRALVPLLALLLSSCAYFARLEPYDLADTECIKSCQAKCDALDPLPAWNGDPNECVATIKRDAWLCSPEPMKDPDTGKLRSSADAEILAKCDGRRAACLACLDVLKKHKVVDF